MTKLFVIDGILFVEDGDIELSKWISNDIHGMIVVRNAFGKIIFKSKVNSENPIETQNGTRTKASDVVEDIGSSWKKYAPKEYTVSVADSANGSTNPIEGDYIVTRGDDFTIEATADEDYRFSFWSINSAEITDNPITINITEGTKITPVFVSSSGSETIGIMTDNALFTNTKILIDG